MPNATHAWAKGSSASGGVEDTGSVGLEDHSVSLDGDSDGLVGKGSLEGGNGVSSDLHGTSDLDVGVGVGDIVLARATDGLVGVRGLAHGEVGGVVVEGEGLVATVASEASLDTVDELLLGEGEELTGANLPGTFKGAGG